MSKKSKERKEKRRTISFSGSGPQKIPVLLLEEIVERAKSEAYNKGLRDFKDHVVLNIETDIGWVGKKRADELGEYFQKSYMSLKYQQEKSNSNSTADNDEVKMP